MHALIIDDSMMMRVLLKEILLREGFQITEASNGKEGLQTLTNNPTIDAVLMDWKMPVMTGYELLQHIRSNHIYNNLPIIMVTAQIETAYQALNAGANGYITKPFTRDVLLEKLQILGIINASLAKKTIASSA